VASSPRHTHGTPRPAVGARAEAVVADYLVAQGFEILGRNVRIGHLEIDLVARRDDLVAIVEVRFRSVASWQGPFQSITPDKRARIRKAGKILWQRRFLRDPSVNRMRFDAAAVSFGPDDEPSVEYVAAAF
jgi:putative endonuclease